jgi:hypothetical protein
MRESDAGSHQQNSQDRRRGGRRFSGRIKPRWQSLRFAWLLCGCGCSTQCGTTIPSLYYPLFARLAELLILVIH